MKFHSCTVSAVSLSVLLSLSTVPQVGNAGLLLEVDAQDASADNFGKILS